MKLKRLEIELQGWGKNAGKYEANVEYEGENGSTKLVLDTEISQELLRFCGPAIHKVSHLTALRLEKSIEQSVIEAQQAPSLEAPASEVPSC